MLTISVVNRTGVVDTPCDYGVTVDVNSEVIWRGVVKGHLRANGWPDLLRRVAAAAEAKRFGRQTPARALKPEMRG